LGFDGSTRIQPERRWENLEIRLKFDDDDCDKEGDRYDRERERVPEEGSQRELWRVEAGNELKSLFDLIHETRMLNDRLEKLRFCDGQSVVEWNMQRMMGMSERPDDEISTLGFTDLSRVWLAMGCEEVV